MTTHFMRSYSLLAIKTCHARDAHAIGGMAAQIPIKNDPDANEEALAKVRADKEREANDGHDGTWVAHPGLVPIALEAFDAVMTGPNQIDRKREDVTITAKDLLTFVPEGPITEAGPAHEHQRRRPVPRRLAQRHRLRADQQPDGGRRHGRDLAQPGLAVDPQRQRRARRRPEGQRRALPHDARRGAGEDPRQVPGDLAPFFDRAAALFDEISTSEDFVDFLTLPAYRMID